MADPISDMLTRIRNAQRAGHKEVLVPASRLKVEIAKILEDKNFIDLVKKEKKGNADFMRIVLKYDEVSKTQKTPAIGEIERVSRQGQRIYVGKNDVRKVKGGYGIAIISTSQGVMTGEEARKRGLGGEYICKVW